MKASQQALSNILNPSNPNEHYHIPKYQRPYSWTVGHCEKLFDDIDDNDAGHFIGSIICKFDENSAAPNTDKINELIDGQQRMTTISILLAAIHNALSHKIDEAKDLLQPDEVDEYKGVLRNVSQQLVRKLRTADNLNQKGLIQTSKSNILLRLQPSSQNENLEDYKHILSISKVLQDVEAIVYFGNRRMAKAYYYFQNRIADLNLQELETLVTKINQLNMVHIQVASSSDAFRLFETLNNRGLPLSAIDIIKNKMLAEMEHKHSRSVDKSYDQWKQMIANIEGIEDRFLRQ
ncbi:MAG: hypothetical protein NVS3B3_13710 [Aquirhabdus sp.]